MPHSAAVENAEAAEGDPEVGSNPRHSRGTAQAISQSCPATPVERLSCNFINGIMRMPIALIRFDPEIEHGSFLAAM